MSAEVTREITGMIDSNRSVQQGANKDADRV